MPDGKTHRSWWLGFLFAPFLVAIVLGVYCLMRGKLGWATAALFIPIGYLLGAIFDPDLDQIGITSAEGRLMKIPILGIVIVAWFIPYGYFFKHRSFLTHFPFVSTAIRLGYLLMLPLTVLAFWTGLPDLVAMTLKIGITHIPQALLGWWNLHIANTLIPWITLGIFFGLSGADMLHWFLDMVVKPQRRDRHRQRAENDWSNNS